MLAPVGIGITGALLIVGVLYSIRMIHRKRRNSFKHQRRKVRQPEVRALPYHPSLPSSSHRGLVLRVQVSRCRFILPSNLESRGRAVRTKPCCWPTAPRTSSDETLSGGGGWCCCCTEGKGGRKPIAMTTATYINPGDVGARVIHRMWRSVGHKFAQRSASPPRPNPTPPVKYQREHFSDCCQVTLKGFTGLVWRTAIKINNVSAKKKNSRKQEADVAGEMRLSFCVVLVDEVEPCRFPDV